MNLSSPVDILILQSQCNFSVLKVYNLQGTQPRFFAFKKITNWVSQFFFGANLTSCMVTPVKSVSLGGIKSLKDIFQNKIDYLSPKNNTFLFFETAKTNNSCVLKFQEDLSTKIFL